VSDGGLPEGDASIVARHLAVCEHLKAQRAQARDRHLEQQSILKAPAGQGDAVEVGLVTQMLTRLDDERRHADMEAPGDLDCRDAAP
jgi:hypothetical protein